MPDSSGPATPPEPKPSITFDEFARVDLRIARVLQAEAHPQADRLLVLQVDDGSGSPRQLCAGIRQQYRPEDLVGRLIVLVANLEPRVIRGVESRGMLLAATDTTPGPDGRRRIVLLTAADEVSPGSIVS